MIRTVSMILAFLLVATESAVAWQTRAFISPVAPSANFPSDSRVASNDTPPAQSRVANRHGSGPVRPAVDMVTLKSGKHLRGAIVHSSQDGSLTMAVSRDWLRKLSPDLYERLTKTEANVRLVALKQLRIRIDQSLVGVPDDSRLAAFLRSEGKRTERMLIAAASHDEPQFIWLDLTRKEVAKIRPASAGNRRIAGWSWFERLANVEIRDGSDLMNELRRKGIDPEQTLPDFSDRFPIRMQNDREWGARLALVVYALDKPLDFQGTGDQLVQADRTPNAKDTAPLIAKVLGGQVDTLVKDLLSERRSTALGVESPDDWLKSAYAQAGQQKAPAFRATRVELNLGGRQASVHSVFAVHMDKGEWKVVWSDRATADGTKERAAIESTIANDPQVKSALANLQSLGVSADSQIRQAIRFGGATMAAQQTVDSRFFEFEGPFLQHLDGPPLWW
jgi:hypothetical protein